MVPFSIIFVGEFCVTIYITINTNIVAVVGNLYNSEIPKFCIECHNKNADSCRAQLLVKHQLRR